jgi:sulfopyruvate decarboxylase TPP-binding subunit
LKVAVGLKARTIVGALREAGATHVVTVPDTHQRSVLELLDYDGEPAVVRAATEDDVLGICGGLWIGGAQPVALIQQLGIFASVNALRGITYDLRLPLAILAGMYGREPELPVDKSPKSSVRLCRPLLDALGIRSLLVEGHDGAERISSWLHAPFSEGGTRVVLLGAVTT